MNEIAILKKRVDDLEQLVASLGGSEALIPTFTKINADGTISAALSGSLQLLADIGSALISGYFSSNHTVEWRNAANQIMAQIIALSAANQGTAAMRAFSPDGTCDATIVEYANQTSGSQIQAIVETAKVSNNVLLIDTNDNSSFIRQIDGLTKLKMQILIWSFVAAAGWNTSLRNLATPYVTHHSLFLANVQGAAGASTSIGRSFPNGLSQGGVDVNSSIAQTITLQAISFGI